MTVAVPSMTVAVPSVGIAVPGVGVARSVLPASVVRLLGMSGVIVVGHPLMGVCGSR
jgi:hypothetical protein